MGYWDSYPEVTGYISVTFFDLYDLSKNITFKRKAIEMLDWEHKIQHPDGSIPDISLENPVIFDTGQVILGFVRGYEETGNEMYRTDAIEASNWLVRQQNDDGSWTSYSFNDVPHSYHSRVAWPLLRVYEITGNISYKEGAINSLNWALEQQEDTGWFRNSGIDPSHNSDPLTHALCYTMRGLLESGVILNNETYINAAKKAADELLLIQREDGGFYGRYNSKWEPTVDWDCLTGTAQAAIIWERLYELTGNSTYHEASKSALLYLIKTQDVRNADQGIQGGIYGSNPVDGDYSPYTILSWSTKFFIDALNQIEVNEQI